MDGTPDSGMPLGFHQLRPELDFRCTPYNHTWVHLKSIVEHFIALLRDFCFWAIFLGFLNRKTRAPMDAKKILIFDQEARIKEKGDSDSTPESPQMVIQSGSGMTKITA